MDTDKGLSTQRRRDAETQRGRLVLCIAISENCAFLAKFSSLCALCASARGTGQGDLVAALPRCDFAALRLCVKNSAPIGGATHFGCGFPRRAFCAFSRPFLCVLSYGLICTEQMDAFAAQFCGQSNQAPVPEQPAHENPETSPNISKYHQISPNRTPTPPQRCWQSSADVPLASASGVPPGEAPPPGGGTPPKPAGGDACATLCPSPGRFCQ